MGSNNQLNGFIERFSYSSARETLIDKIKTSLIEQNEQPPADSMLVLDLQIRKLMGHGLCKPYAIVQGTIERDFHPNSRSKNGLSELFIEHFDRDWNLGEYASSLLTETLKRSLHVNIDITGYRNLVFKFKVNGHKITFKTEFKYRPSEELPLDDWLLGLKHIAPNIFNNCTGIGIKKIGKDGRMLFSNTQHYLGSPNDYVFTYFNEGNVYFFNQEGTLIPEKIDGTNIRTILKVQGLTESFNAYNVTSSVDEAQNYLLNEWIRDEKQFSGQGLELLLEGQDINRVQSGGYVTLRCYEKSKDGKKQREKLHVGKRFYNSESTEDDVIVKWKGPYVLVVDKDDPKTVLNVEKLDHDFGIETHGQRIFDKIGSMFYLRNIKSKGFKQATINGVTYLFYKADLNEIKAYNPDATHALFAHITNDSATFQVLEKSGSNVVKYDITPYKVLTKK